MAIAVGCFALLRAVVPQGYLAGPFVLILGGVAWLAAATGHLPGRVGDHVVPLLVVTVGAGVALSRPRLGPGRVMVPVVRFQSLLIPVRERVAESRTLQKVVIRSVFGYARIDMSRILVDARGDLDDVSPWLVDVDVSVLFGRVELLVGQDCAVVPGKLGQAYGVDLEEATVSVLTAARTGDDKRNDLARDMRLNVLGLGGAVSVTPVLAPPTS
ncbi:hypothetical protein QF026_002411 [Streptomyces aurantiacus]|uniref:hypothetical protein n=1 Tax=Streptomyces aurantiacus TaxID=47760 RepID=UPI0027903E2F|nr:hypothetical protein [Streptomyces aurantiacus]MDQ0773945.1 hypothetical protein [Streptomyces aurantiacus]